MERLITGNVRLVTWRRSSATGVPTMLLRPTTCAKVAVIVKSTTTRRIYAFGPLVFRLKGHNEEEDEEEDGSRQRGGTI